MEQAHTRALAALQPFIHLATSTKSPSSRFLTDLIIRATSAPGTYVFTELLQLPPIQSLRSADTPPEHASHLSLLEIFSWGTYSEYLSAPNLPALNEVQTHKLQQLSLLSHASPFLPHDITQQYPTLSYNHLISQLSLPDASSLESLVRSSIYAGLLTASLSPTSTPATVHIHSVAPLRDLRPHSLPALLQILSTWSSRCDAVISDLNTNIASIRETARQRNELASRRQDIVDHAVVDEKTGGSNENTDAEKKSGAGTGARLKNFFGRASNKRDSEEIDEESEDDSMDVDEGIGEMGSGSFSVSHSVAAGIGRGGGGGPSRGSKRGRGRG